MDERENRAQIDHLARKLAAEAGVSWDRLEYYPGYLRGVWRSEAALYLRRAGTEPRA